LGASDAELLVQLFQDLDAGVVDADELKVIFHGNVRWPRVIAEQKKLKRALAQMVLEPEDPPDDPPPAQVPTSAPALPPRPDKAAILRKLRAKAG